MAGEARTVVTRGGEVVADVHPGEVVVENVRAGEQHAPGRETFVNALAEEVVAVHAIEAPRQRRPVLRKEVLQKCGVAKHRLVQEVCTPRVVPERTQLEAVHVDRVIASRRCSERGRHAETSPVESFVAYY